MTSVKNVSEMFAGMMLTGNIKYCPEPDYSKLLKIIDSKTIVSPSILPHYNYSLPIYSHPNINHRFEDNQAKGA